MSLLKRRIQAKKMGEQRKIGAAKPLTDKPRIVAGLGIVLDTTKSEEFMAEIDRRISFKARFAKETKDRQEKLSEMRGEVATAQRVKAEKEPWEMTRDEFYKNQVEISTGKHSPYQVKEAKYVLVHKDKEKSGQPHTSSGWRLHDCRDDMLGSKVALDRDSVKRVNDIRKNIVEEAVKAGKPVPPEVLADYPDLKATAQKSTPTLTDSASRLKSRAAKGNSRILPIPSEPTRARMCAKADKVQGIEDVPAAELEEGASVETEHGATYENIKAYYAEHGEFPPFDTVTEWIAIDHLKEFADYYEALEAMEAELKAGKKPEAEAMRTKAAEGGPRFDMKKYKTITTKTMKTIDDYSDYSGGDASLETSLFEYGLIWKDQGSDYHFIYGVGMDDDGNHNSFDYSDVGKDVNPEEEWSFANFDDMADFAGMTKDDFLKQSIPAIVEVLVSYYGNENVFGPSYHPFKIADSSKSEGVDTKAMKAKAISGNTEKAINKAVNEYWEPKLGERGNRLINWLNFDLYHGPYPAGTTDEEDNPNATYPGFTSAIDELRDIIDNAGGFQDMWYDNDSGELMENEPEAYEDEETGEMIEPYLEETYHLEGRDVAGYVLGKELVSYVI